MYHTLLRILGISLDLGLSVSVVSLISGTLHLVGSLARCSTVHKIFTPRPNQFRGVLLFPVLALWTLRAQATSDLRESTPGTS